jgi:hypothetical protein
MRRRRGWPAVLHAIRFRFGVQISVGVDENTQEGMNSDLWFDRPDQTK